MLKEFRNEQGANAQHKQQKCLLSSSPSYGGIHRHYLKSFTLTIKAGSQDEVVQWLWFMPFWNSAELLYYNCAHYSHTMCFITHNCRRIFATQIRLIELWDTDIRYSLAYQMFSNSVLKRYNIYGDGNLSHTSINYIPGMSHWQKLEDYSSYINKTESHLVFLRGIRPHWMVVVSESWRNMLQILNTMVFDLFQTTSPFESDW